LPPAAPRAIVPAGRRKEVTMAQKDTTPTNERILLMLGELKAELEASRKREEQIARDLARLLARS
jgi:hypothetical protein